MSALSVASQCLLGCTILFRIKGDGSNVWRRRKARNDIAETGETPGGKDGSSIKQCRQPDDNLFPLQDRLDVFGLRLFENDRDNSRGREGDHFGNPFSS